MEEKSKTQKIPKKRSPNYPIIPLNEAIGISQKIYEKYSRTAAPISLVMDYLDYSAKSSKTLQIPATLSYYGLITTEGSGKDRKIKITDLAFTIIKSPDASQRDSAIKVAALKPTQFNDTREKYPEMPDPDVLKYELEKEGKFNLKTIPEFIDVFMKTMTLAKIYESGIIGEEIKEKNGQNTDLGDKKMTNLNLSPPDSSKRLPPFPATGQEMEIANYPAGPGLTIRITVSGGGAITQKSIEKLIKHLELDKEYFPLENETKES